MTDHTDLVRQHVREVGLVQTARTQALCMTQNYSAELIRQLADAIEQLQAERDTAQEDAYRWRTAAEEMARSDRNLT